MNCSPNGAGLGFGVEVFNGLFALRAARANHSGRIIRAKPFPEYDGIPDIFCRQQRGHQEVVYRGFGQVLGGVNGHVSPPLQQEFIQVAGEKIIRHRFLGKWSCLVPVAGGVLEDFFESGFWPEVREDLGGFFDLAKRKAAAPGRKGYCRLAHSVAPSLIICAANVAAWARASVFTSARRSTSSRPT